MKRGFTLIELLVVIAIIAILAAILFPVFGKAREKARQTHCTNNQKSFATAVQIYTQEHEETFPSFKTFWGDIRVDKGALKCMTMPSIPNGYMYNPGLSGKGIGEMKDGTAIKSADLIWLTSDGIAPASPPTWASSPNVAYRKDYIDYRHNDKNIASYADGHVTMSDQPTFEANFSTSTGGVFGAGNVVGIAGDTLTFVSDFPATFTTNPTTLPAGVTMSSPSDTSVVFTTTTGLASLANITVTATPITYGAVATQAIKIFPKPIAADDFQGTGTFPAALNGVNSGTGWGAPWKEQNSHTVIPGYCFVNTNPLTYATLTSTPGYGVGGHAYESFGRKFDNSATGAFAAYLNGTNIGKDGSVLWISFLARSDNNKSQSFYFHTNGNAQSYNAGNLQVEGANAGFWRLGPQGGTMVTSTKGFSNATVYFVAVKVTFNGASDTAQLFVNPACTGVDPVTPDATATGNWDFHSFSWYPGSGTGTDGSVDEIRVGGSFASVAPIASF